MKQSGKQKASRGNLILSKETGDKKQIGLVEKLVEGLVESQKKIIKLIEENPYISKSKLSKKVGISTTAIDKNILKLKDKGLLKRVGPDKGGYWEVISHEPKQNRGGK